MEVKQEVSTILQIHTEALAEKYLGLPTALGRSTKEAFEFMPNNLRGLVGTWSGREASCAGREVLLKSVAQAVPTYPMSCFLIPKESCRKMRTIISNYWWGSSADNRRMHWLRWDHLTRPKCSGGMGFRDLNLFNLAMLGKQGWRLITSPESLCARVLKGRYYHDTDFLHATRKKHASHTWRAILAGREVLQQGLIRRIGDGSTTHIWIDRWIPNHFSGKPISVPTAPSIVVVADLLTASGGWNAELVKQNFVEFDAQAILRTPIRGSGEDTWAWEPERHGTYTVKSAYRRSYELKWHQTESERASSSDGSIWNRIWKLCVPPKVRVFWWRVVNGFLPARGVLLQRHIEPIANCEVCGAGVETIKHALMDCTIARFFWNQTKALTGVKIPGHLHPVTWAHDLLDPKICTEQDAAVILCGMWALWMSRNKRRHGEAGVPMNQAIKWAKDTAFDLWQICHPTKSKRSQPTTKEQWRCPTMGWTKCNTDASFRMGNSTGSVGAVLQDHEGQFQGAQAKWIGHCLSALAAEALACVEGASLALRRGVHKLEIETDCQVLVKLWESRTSQRSEISPILSRLEDICRDFRDVRLSFVPRTCNQVAHICAQLASADNPLVEWLSPPMELQSHLHVPCNLDSHE